MPETSVSTLCLYGSIALSVFFTVVNFNYWLSRRDERVYFWLMFWFAASTIFTTAHLLLYCRLEESHYSVAARIIIAVAYAMVWFGFGFVNAYTGYNPTTKERTIFKLLVAVPILVICGTDLVVTDQVVQRTTVFGEQFHGVRPNHVIYAPTGVLFLSLLSLLCLRLARAPHPPGREKLLVAAGMLAAVLFSFNDMVTHFFDLHWIRLFDFAFLPLGVAFGYAQVQRYSRLYNELETRVRERTAELFGTNQSLEKEIVDRRAAEERARTQERMFRTLFDNALDLMGSISLDGVVLSANRTALDLIGATEDAVRGKPFWDTPWWAHSPTLQERLRMAVVEAGAKGQTVTFEATHPTITGQLRIIDFSLKPVLDDHGRPYVLLAEGRDSTERKQLEEQVLQARKMDAIGHLAGGIAHDFNNLLVPIVAYVELGMMGLSPEDELHADLKQVHSAAMRAADLTRQILAFSRKQVLEMRTVNLNEVVVDVEKMLLRLIREDIELQSRLTPSLALVKADRSQIEQILLNLVVNARDAMPTGGKLIVMTDNVVMDEMCAEMYAQMRPGAYVMLAVSDSGHGMDAETRRRIFEPFFTTKEKGRGTGLGLATVHGIVRQHDGHILVYSEPGKGTTFKIYLPQTTAGAEPAGPAVPDIAFVRGQETVLVVEDEEMVRNLVCKTLRAYGYTVITSPYPDEALKLASTCEGPLHLLLTDVIMPKMNGRELFQRVGAVHPDIKVLYMSGYTDDIIVHHGILEEQVNFLQKPFTVHDFVQKVRKVLG